MTVDMSGLLQNCAREAERLPNVRIHTEIDPDIHVTGNVTDLRRVINNIIENARRHGRTSGQALAEINIGCSVKATGHGWRSVIEIADRGAGMPGDQIDRLLKPFTRLDCARGQANGAGLGLAIVDRVVGRHNAQLQLRNRDGDGLLVQIALPFAV